MAIRLYFLSCLSALIMVSCQSNNQNDTHKEKHSNGIEVYGEAQGTTYAVLCNDDIELTKKEIDSLLSDFDDALSTYKDSSIVSQLNNASSGLFKFKDPHDYFKNCFLKSREIYQKTNGAFDPTVGSVMSLWKFEDEKPQPPDSVILKKALKSVSFEKGTHLSEIEEYMDTSVNEKYCTLEKISEDVHLDFNAIAQGMSVDVISQLIESKGGENYLVEIGGELRSKGKNAEGKNWRVGVDQPTENSTAENRTLTAIVEISGQAIATSGNYRKFFEHNGEKYAHTIDPQTGYPVKHSLLSTTVVAPTCVDADAYATAFMVMGVEKTKIFLEENHGSLAVFLIYTNPSNGKFETFTSSNMKELIKMIEN